ncbi:MAG: hypothetical protein PHF84_04000 [bacterium]|nr:hypothetical protein [bacterium]
MNAQIREFRKCLFQKLTGLIRKIRHDRADFMKEYEKKFHKKTGYVWFENIATYDEEIESVTETRNILKSLRISKIQDIAEYRSLIISRLEAMQAQMIRLRAGIRLILDCIRDLSRAEKN